MTDESEAMSDVQVVDGVAIALIGGFLAGAGVGFGYASDTSILTAIGAILFGVTFALAYVRLAGMPDIRRKLSGLLGSDDQTD